MDKVKTIAEIFHKSTVVTEADILSLGMSDGDVRAKAQTGVCYKVELNILYSKTHSQVTYAIISILAVVNASCKSKSRGISCE